MASPKQNTAFTFRVAFYLGSTPVASPTLAAGDAVVFTAGANTGNLNTLTSQTYGADCTASATQMNGADVLIQFTDQTSPRAWDPFTIRMNLDVREVDDLAFPTVSGRSLDVTATGGAGIDWANVENPTTTLDLSGTSTKAVEPTVPGRTLDVTATGAAGIDLANVENQGSTLALTATTVANLTNAPTSGDLTAAMKASVTTAATAATPTAAAVTGAVGSVTAPVSLTGDLTATMKTSVTTAATAATPVAASVAGAVGSVAGNVVGSVGSVTAPVVVGSTSVGALDAGSFTSAAQNAFADKLLDRDMSTGTDSGSPTVRTPRQALRVLRNKVDIPNGKVKKEDDTTDSWTFVATTLPGDPVTVVDPA